MPFLTVETVVSLDAFQIFIQEQIFSILIISLTTVYRLQITEYLSLILVNENVKLLLPKVMQILTE